MAKATLRRNGHRMVTVLARHHLRLNDAAMVLADHWCATVPDLRGKGQRWAARQIRTYLEIHGEDHLQFADERWQPEELEESFAAARQFLINIGMFVNEPW